MTNWNAQPGSAQPGELAFAVPSGHDPIVDRFSFGDLEIEWNVAAPTYLTAEVRLTLQDREIASHVFSPGSYSWAPGAIEAGGRTLDFAMQFLPASPAGNGELTLVSLTLAPAAGETLHIQKVTLQGWDFVGAGV
jgi:hypothetical protein